ncbi:MAG TPA: hypothetical protein VJ252_05830, partial [Chthoniobacterales bacterium]|nr:hypothetical protein [Chthoniobacterales bacterium]
IHCSRFSPYIFVGDGIIFGGGESATFIDDESAADADATVISDGKARFIGQMGGGLEVRITHRIGITSDFSWNVIEGINNNFGMVRSGLNFAF